MSPHAADNIEHRITRIEESVRRLEAELLGNSHRRGMIPALQHEVEKLKEFRFKSTGMIIAAVSLLGFLFKLWR